MLIRHCAPTLAGMKTGSLFACHVAEKEQFTHELRRMNRILRPKGIRVIPLHKNGQRALVYVFRPDQLSRDLLEPQALAILMDAGYCAQSMGRCVNCLIRRLRTSIEFPHEIGLFLGYPPEDVRGFIENKAAHYKTAGAWKVYGNEQAAKERFACYQHCTKSLWGQFNCGSCLEALAVTA